jgi:hypothetical protein
MLRRHRLVFVAAINFLPILLVWLALYYAVEVWQAVETEKRIDAMSAYFTAMAAITALLLPLWLELRKHIQEQLDQEGKLRIARLDLSFTLNNILKLYGIAGTRLTQAQSSGAINMIHEALQFWSKDVAPVAVQDLMMRSAAMMALPGSESRDLAKLLDELMFANEVAADILIALNRHPLTPREMASMAKDASESIQAIKKLDERILVWFTDDENMSRTLRRSTRKKSY